MATEISESPLKCTSPILMPFLKNLISPDELVQRKAAKSFLNFVATRSQMVTSEHLEEVYADQQAMIDSQLIHEKKGGIYATVVLLRLETTPTEKNKLLSRGKQFLLWLIQDESMNVLVSKAIGYISKNEIQNTTRFGNNFWSQAINWLDWDSQLQPKKIASLLLIKELARNAQSYYHYDIDEFYERAFSYITDSSIVVRNSTVKATRACLALSCSRDMESRSKPWVSLYKQANDYLNPPELQTQPQPPVKGKDKSIRDDKIHCYLLVILELMRISSLSCDYDKYQPFINDDNDDDALASEFISDDDIPSPFSFNAIVSSLQLDGKSNFKCHPYSDASYNFISQKYNSICDEVLSHLKNKSPIIITYIVKLLPWLGLFNPQLFLQNHLITAMHFLKSLTTEKDHVSSAFNAIGLLILALDTVKLPKAFLQSATEAIRSKLTFESTKKINTVHPYILKCMSYLIRSGFGVFDDFKRIITTHLELMDLRLSEELIQVLKDIIENDNSLKTKKLIQTHLLKYIFMILIHKTVQHPGVLPKNYVPADVQIDDTPADYIVLALYTLANFGFDDVLGIAFHLKLVANTYLNHSDKNVRIQTVKTCASLLAPTIPKPSQINSQFRLEPHHQAAALNVSFILDLLLISGVADAECEVRLTVYQSLTSMYDGYMAQSENLQKLFVAFHDELFEIRLEVLSILGRLNVYNPAYLLPSLRKTLVQLLDDLRLTSIGIMQEQSAQLLACLISCTPILVKSYCQPIVDTMIPILKQPSTPLGVTMSVLQAIAMQAQVSQTAMKSYSEKIIPLLKNILQDATIEKTLMVLWTLGQLLENTGYVLDADLGRPQMMDILYSYLKVGQHTAVRRQSIRVLGLLGALDPHKYLTYQQSLKKDVDFIKSFELQSSTQGNITSEIWVSLPSRQLEDFYPQVAIRCLLRILNDPSCSSLYPEAAEAFPNILQNLGDKVPIYVKLIVPTILNIIENSPEDRLKAMLFSNLRKIISISGSYAKDYMPKIFDLITVAWVGGLKQKELIELISELINKLGSEFHHYLPKLIHHMLSVLVVNPSESKANVLELLKAIQLSGANVDDYLHMLLPPLIKLLEISELGNNIRKEVLKAILKVSTCIDFTEFISPIVHTLSRIIYTCPELRGDAIMTLTAIIPNFGKRYELFIPMMKRVFDDLDITDTEYNHVVTKIKQNRRFDSVAFKPPNDYVMVPHGADDAHATSEKFQRMNILSLSDAWLTTSNHNIEDWQEWLRRLCLKLTAEVPNKPLRALSNVCKSYVALSREIFNATFLSCWENLPQLHKEEVITSLDEALNYSKCPEIIQIILNLVEFIEHLPSITLPLKNELLAKSAYDSRAYAKALRYKEKEFRPEKIDTDLLESLIDLNNKLQQPDASIGVLDWAEKGRGNTKTASWYESLQYWPKALETYKDVQYTKEDGMKNTLGQLRCLEAMSEWELLLETSLDKFKKAESEDRTKIARIACYSAWGLSQWKDFETFVQYIPENTQNGSFYRIVTSIRDNNFVKARNYITQSRNMMDTELSVLVGESYTRAYKAMVFVQNLSELEEVVNLLEDFAPSKKEEVTKTWWDRLQGCYYDVEDWQRILLVRSLIISPIDDAKSWLKYASLCRKSGKHRRAEETLNLLQRDANPYQHLISYAHYKYRWATTQDPAIKSQIIEEMDYFIKAQISNYDKAGSSDFQKHMSKCYLLAGKWSQTLPRNNGNILSYFKSATEYNPRSYKAWHAWAITNFDLANESTQGNQQLADSQRKKSIQINFSYILSAIEGFFQSISLSKDSLQDALRLLTLWFNYGHFRDIYERLELGIQTTSIDTWLQVIPQLIARIDSPSLNVRKLVQTVLILVGKKHPQALVYPVTVASKSSMTSRAEAARSVLNSIAGTQAELVSQAVLISEELIRIAILWHEQWHEGLEEASRLYFGESNVQGMLATLEPLHKLLDSGPQTLKEMSFSQAYGRDLHDAQDWCKKYKQTKNLKDLNQAWDAYYYVFKRISIQLPELITLELKSVSHKLSEAKNMVLPVPGTYKPGQESIFISEISPMLNVIPSKQRPRRLTIKGSNGMDYQFLLKGHEDLRQDERVMQLFGLVNNLLANDSDTFKKQLFIQKYAVIPLSPNSGLIGWVPDCDTMHQLIKDYREKNNVILNIEHRSMLRYSQDYEHLPLIQKVEVFLRALENSKGDDLARIMWLKSPSSEIWFSRRTNYTRSLSVMSMVGYILGLGDRHPSNLMMDRLSGRVLHIDFGDCFEVAMTRDKFPEKIPFRITRMLVKAMEVTGLSGTFKNTCQSVMRVIRLNEDSIMAVLEAFVYDPLLSWRLVDAQQNEISTKSVGKPVQTIETGSSNVTNRNIDDLGAMRKPPTNIRHHHQCTLDEEEELPQTEVNKKALMIKSRINDKLKGNDFLGYSSLNVEDQVQLLINQATSNENLCQCYIGWCPFW